MNAKDVAQHIYHFECCIRVSYYYILRESHIIGNNVKTNRTRYTLCLSFYYDIVNNLCFKEQIE